MLTRTQIEGATREELEELRERIEAELARRQLAERESPENRQVVEEREAPRGTYRLEKVHCGKKNCRKCAEGPAHGPYWYHYFYKNGRLTSEYVGKEPKEEDRERFPELFEQPDAASD
jgi:hypothetical protein